MRLSIPWHSIDQAKASATAENKSWAEWRPNGMARSHRVMPFHSIPSSACPDGVPGPYGSWLGGPVLPSMAMNHTQ